MAMMTLGLFVFSINTLPYQEFKRRVAWRHPSNSRVGARPASQFLGVDDETITLSGVLLPEITGGRLSLETIETMANQGRSWPLIEGTGAMLGLFVIESLDITKSVFFSDGAARRYEFTLQLKREENTAKLGDLASIIKGLLL